MMRDPIHERSRRPRMLLRLVALALAGGLLWAAAAVGAEESLEALPESAAEEEVITTPSTFETKGQDLSVLSVLSRPEGARVFVDGEDRGTTPLYIRDLDDGSHEVILYMAGFGAFRQMLEGSGGRIFVDLDAEKGLGIGFLAIRTDPADARVEVDGKKAGLSPLEIPLEAGRHTVRLSKAGFKDVDEVVDVEAEGRQSLDVALVAKEGALLVISSPVGGEVFVDGKSVGKTWEPFRVENVVPGVHAVRVEKQGFRTWQKPDVVVRSAETTTILAALLPERDYSWVRLFTEPAGARVWLDGAEMGVAGKEGLGFKAQKGAHHLRLEVDPATQPGYQPLQVTVNFAQDDVDYSADPIALPPVNEHYVNALKLIERGQKEEALGFLDRVPPEHPGYAEARLLVVEVLGDLGRVREIPQELGRLVARPEHGSNPVLNTALGYWSLVAARDLRDSEATTVLEQALGALERAVQSMDLFPPEQREPLILKAHYYAGMASEILFNLTGEKRYVKKGAQSWEVFFARLELNPRALEGAWIEKARSHRRNLEFLAKKLGG